MALIFSMGVSVDGFINDSAGRFAWAAPDDELFGFHLERVSELGAILCGRRLYETMLVWETDPALRGTEFGTAFADVWSALPKVVFSRTLTEVRGAARLAVASLVEEVAAAAPGEQDVEIGGADLAAQAFAAKLVDELRIFRYPILVGNGSRFRAPVASDVRLRLCETRRFAGDVILERYGVI